VLREVSDGVDLRRIGRGELVREMRQGKAERIGGRRGCGDHRWRRISPETLAGAAEFGERSCRDRSMPSGGSKGKRGRSIGAIYSRGRLGGGARVSEQEVRSDGGG
jgi:hypothetical protein